VQSNTISVVVIVESSKYPDLQSIGKYVIAPLLEKIKLLALGVEE
jgi:hypothetical protein